MSTRFLSDSRHHKLLWAIFLIALGLRALDVWRPVDGSVWEAWREPDVAGIARNYYREDMNLFYPRIDWRGDGPGFVESEFPLFSWTGAVVYHSFGYHEELLRVFSLILGLGSWLLLHSLATRLLTRPGVLVCLLLFSLNPLAVRMATSIQPEPLMMFCLLLGLERFHVWMQDQRVRDYLLSLTGITLAILVKLPAAHVGIVLAGLSLQFFGWQAVRKKSLWLFILISLTLPAIWYAHAHQFWLEYDNSLGISNEAYRRISSGSFLAHLIGMIQGNLKHEIHQVWMPTGAFLGLMGLLTTWKHSSKWILLYWTASLTLFYLVAGRTTGEDWAGYYHILSVPLACLLMGAGFEWIRERIEHRQTRRTVSRIALILILLATCGQAVRQVRWQHHPQNSQPLFETAVSFRNFVEPRSLIVVSGDPLIDETGLSRAVNAPYFFYWLDCHGFTLPQDQQSLVQLEELRQRGAKYYILERKHLNNQGEFSDKLLQRYTILCETQSALLIDLNSVSTPSQSTASQL